MGVDSHLKWPTGHGGWFYSGLAAFEGGAAHFLAQGVWRRERVLYVAEDPGVRRWPRQLVDEGVLVLGAAEDLYAPLRAGELNAQRGVFENAVADALRDGFVGIRVAADNTRMVIDDLERWVEWESVAGAFIAANPVTGLCGFDRSRLSLDDTHAMMHLHPRVVETV